MAAIAVTPAAPTAIVDACRIDVTEADLNAGESDLDAYPVQAEQRYYLAFIKGGVEYGRSYVFAPGADGAHSFPNYHFPSDGSWSVSLRKVSDDSEVVAEAVTVS